MRWMIEDFRTGWQNMPTAMKVLNVASVVTAFIAIGLALAAL